MVVDYLKGRERLVQYALLGVAGVSAVLMLVKVVDYFVSSAKAQSIVEEVVSQGEPNEAVVKEKLAGLRKIADALKSRNLFVPPPPRQHPVNAVLGIMGDEALINDKWYKAGDKIGDAMIVAVEPTQVKIEWDGNTKYFAPLASTEGPSGPPSGRRGPGRGGDPAGPGPTRVEVLGPGPDRGGFGNMSEEQRAEMRARMEGMRARFESMSPEEREAFRNEMRSRFGGRGPGEGGFGGGGGGRGRR
ncbi:MAG: hypothetical protein JXN61_15440 [Sedimentisphaerales bacterium]|nr:hypothetical protein [Sedimentisphaerales bacterium]